MAAVLIAITTAKPNLSENRTMGPDSFKSDFKRNFLAGLAALFPIVLTIFVVLWVYGKVEKVVGSRVNRAAATFLARNPDLFSKAFPNYEKTVPEDHKKAPEQYAEAKAYAEKNMPKFLGAFVGLLIILIFIYLTGSIIRGYIGSKLMGSVDRIFERFPVIKTIYPHARQLTNMLFTNEQKKRFGRVVAIQYPRKGVYALGFLTGTAYSQVNDLVQQDMVTVFVPTSPTPVTGFVVFLPKDEVVDVDVTVDQAFRFFITAGFVSPDSEKGALKNGMGMMDPAGVGAEKAGTTEPRPDPEEKAEGENKND